MNFLLSTVVVTLQTMTVTVATSFKDHASIGEDQHHAVEEYNKISSTFPLDV